MSLNRGQAVALGVFVVALIIVSVLFVWQRTSVRPLPERSAIAMRAEGTERLLDSERARPSGAGEVGDRKGSAFLADTPDAYRVITTRNLFRPMLPPPAPISPRSQGTPSAASRPAAARPADRPLVARQPPADRQSQAAPLPPPPPPLPFPDQPPLPPPEIPIERVAITGFLQVGEGWMVLVENLQTNEVRVAFVGEQAWGWEIAQVDPVARRFVLRHGDNEQVLRLGQNKQPRDIKPAATGGRPAQAAPQQQPQMGPPTPPPSFGGGGQGRLSDAVMNRVRQRFGGQIPPEIEARIREFLD